MDFVADSSPRLSADKKFTSSVNVTHADGQSAYKHAPIDTFSVPRYSFPENIRINQWPCILNPVGTMSASLQINSFHVLTY